MQKSAIAVETVKNLQAGSKRLLEGILGQELQENQQVFIMAFNPVKEPDEIARKQARAGLEDVFRKTAAYAQDRGITEDEVDAAIREAMDQIRHRKE